MGPRAFHLARQRDPTWRTPLLDQLPIPASDERHQQGVLRSSHGDQGRYPISIRRAVVPDAVLAGRKQVWAGLWWGSVGREANVETVGSNTHTISAIDHTSAPSSRANATAEQSVSTGMIPPSLHSPTSPSCPAPVTLPPSPRLHLGLLILLFL
jgi:hypothetical protein